MAFARPCSWDFQLRGLFGWESHGFLVVVGFGPFRYGLPGWGGLLVWQVSVRTSSVASFYRIWFFIIGIIDTILTNVLLVTLFYCILTPYSLLIRVFKSDSMRRSIDSESESYFESAEKPKGSESYYNQF